MERMADCFSPDDINRAKEFKELTQRNILDNKAVLGQLLGGFKDFHKIKKYEPVKRQFKRRSDPTFLMRPRRNPSRCARPASTRARSGRSSSIDIPQSLSVSDSPFLKAFTPQRLFVKLKRLNLSRFDENDNESGDYSSVKVYDDDDDDDDCGYKSAKKRRVSSIWRPKSDRHLQEVTEEDIKLIAKSSSNKVYDQVHGTTCHQCRQKTFDTKTICRSEDCFGVRGMFCGPCLRNRYGEDAAESLRDKNWLCPPCRSICNCSFCRQKNGKSSTGILIHFARQHGFDNVSSYLLNSKY